MSPRPVNCTRKRPLSAVYLGKDPLYIYSPPNLPDLPEPPSPVASTSSKGSGLPSPPATNSTGSGSTGDPASVARRNRPHPGEMLTESNVKTFHHAFEEEQDGFASRSVDPDDDDDYDNDNDNNDDEDNTARLNGRHSSISSSENVQALERVKSLTQRNRMALDKLSSYSRLSTPSPKPRHPTTPKRHALPFASSSSQSSSSSSSRTRSSRHSHQITPDHQSGSETERENLHPPIFSTNPHSSSSNSSSQAGSSDPRPSTPRSRQRLISAPSLPGQVLAAKSNSSHSSNSSIHIRKRASIALTETSSPYRSKSPDRDVMQSALAAVASSRRSPTVGLGKKRQPLPPEFRDSPSGGDPISHRNGVNNTLTRSSTLQFSSLPKPPARSSTVRDLTRRHQTRWMSEDLLATSPTDDNDEPTIGRRQTRRGGSAESGLTVSARGRSLVGEGLRAAGIGLKDGEERRGSDVRTRASTVGQRAATSMAEYGRDYEDDNDASPSVSRQLRSHRSAYPLRDRDSSASRREVERSQSSLSVYSGQDRHSSPRVSGIQQSGHHTELMHDSLSMFESQVNRVQLIATSDLLRNAQGIVTAAERLQGLMKGGNGRALEQQINAEVGDRDMDADLVEIWSKVGGEYREGMRASDELVRAVTSFLLGVGKAVKDLSGAGDTHNRSISLDEEGLTGRLSRLHLTPETPVNGNGRRSAESRRSWDIRDREREEATRRLNARAESVLAVRSPSALNTLRNEDYARSVFDTPSPHRNATTNGASSGSIRRVQPREPSIRVDVNGVATLDSQDTADAFDPSPTPASRINRIPDRSQTLPPLDIPKPLPTLPSESLRARLPVTPTPPSEKRPQDRNGDQQNQTLSRRKNLNTIFSVRSPNTTTALTTHTVSNSPDRGGFPGVSPSQRTDSNKSNRTSVTFSRPSTVSISTLNGLQQQDERQRKSSSSGSVDADEAEIVAGVNSPMSGSETERDWRRMVNRSTRMSLDGTHAGHAADRSAASSILPASKRERRRTVVDIWPPAGR
ncbi:uncharacterized protein BT62DRAFT_932779 [Guyanagaster necrorhizus]|uniref:Uncharacterized protein n=1 Tax=Guyanagaster necrorhizus TaxID=856835 RepID=A0A9P7VQL5_9AGAR|nr:uncharacterized protein BT62DRAFT_932779 [Guyanagaster necrorhizus MCA 3950]KAG7445621.1 hypothetical protein BT62DRAFT_932779 [Guyanagaster necrorhizus MCA 3950]